MSKTKTGPRFGFNTLPNLDFRGFSTQKKILRHIMLNMNERMNESLFDLNYKIINIVRLFNFTRSAILPTIYQNCIRLVDFRGAQFATAQVGVA